MRRFHKNHPDCLTQSPVSDIFARAVVYATTMRALFFGNIARMPRVIYILL